MKFQILVCDGPSCGVTHDSDRLVDCAHAELVKNGQTNVEIARFTCFDHCDDGPNLYVRTIMPGEKVTEPDGALFASRRGFYQHMNEEKLCRVLREHCTSGEPVEELVTDY
jgi:(2Fe-2S) ferredoxin